MIMKKIKTKPIEEQVIVITGASSGIGLATAKLAAQKGAKVVLSDTPFTEHARNQLREGESSLPSPMYSPDVVAEAILKCAVEPQRDVFVGGPAKMFAILEMLMPHYLAKNVGSLTDNRSLSFFCSFYCWAICNRTSYIQ